MSFSSYFQMQLFSSPSCFAPGKWPTLHISLCIYWIIKTTKCLLLVLKIIASLLLQNCTNYDFSPSSKGSHSQKMSSGRRGTRDILAQLVSRKVICFVFCKTLPRGLGSSHRRQAGNHGATPRWFGNRRCNFFQFSPSANEQHPFGPGCLFWQADDYWRRAHHVWGAAERCQRR